MRNWHHKVIKIDQARSLLTSVNNMGSSDIYIGVIEGEIEFKKSNNVPFPLTPNNYEPSHLSFSDIQGSRKVFFRGEINGNFNQELRKKFIPSLHTTCVTGIISGNTDSINLVEGISPDIRVINAPDFENGLFLSLINLFSNGNIKSPFFNANFDKKFINNGPSSSTDLYSDKLVSIINCSFDIGFRSLQVDFILKELFAYGRDGRGTLVVVSAGNGDATTGNGIQINDSDGSSGFRSTVFSKKTLIVAASKVKLDYYTLSSYLQPNPVFKEEKSTYSNYGERVDLCAPSGPDANPSKDDINIYSPAMLNCGDVGTNQQVFNVTIIDKPSSNKLILANVKGVFKGQSIELGQPNTYTHEIRYITNVEQIANTNDVKITLNERVKYTDNNSNTGNYNLINTSAKLLVFKKQTFRYFDSGGNMSNNRINLDNLKGIKASSLNHQKVYIYEINSPLNGIYTEIIDVLNFVNNTVELQNSLQSFLPTDQLVLIPDQITASLRCITGEGYIAINIDEIKGFFAGQEVLLSDGSNSRIAFIEGIDGIQVGFFHFPGNTGTNYTITSLAYGDFTSRFTGTSAAAPIVSGLAGLILSANNNLNAAEIKHILKSTTDKIGNTGSYSLVTNPNKYNFGYETDGDIGTGRVNAQKAIQLALDWHNTVNPTQVVQKPNLQIADKLNGTNIVTVPDADPVDSPDIWLNELSTPNTTPLNTLDTSKDQIIYVRVRNTGNRQSFKECDLRVFIAFTDEDNPPPAFRFPNSWYDQPTVKLLAVKEIPIIPAGGETTVAIEWKNIVAFWNANNQKDAITGLRKRAYILAHIAPFDGLDAEVMIDNIRHNKQLTCKEIIVTHNGVSDRTVFLPGNKLDITVGTELVSKSFDLAMENVLVSELDTIKIKAIKKNRQTQATDEIVFKKIGTAWAVESGSGDWIEFQTPTEVASVHNNYKNIVFPHKLTVNDEEDEVKLEILNA